MTKKIEKTETEKINKTFFFENSDDNQSSIKEF